MSALLLTLTPAFATTFGACSLKSGFEIKEKIVNEENKTE